jgi:WD40 repeat protein
VPNLIKKRWPHAQLVDVRVDEWAKEDAAEQARVEERAVSRVMQGIAYSEGQVRDEELAEALRLRKELEVALAEARSQRNVATAALLAARGELLIDEGVLSSAQCGALLVAECLHRVPRTLQGHRAWAKAMSFFPPQIESAGFRVANGVAALSIGRAKNVVAVGSANQTIVLDVATQSRYWFDHKGPVQAVAVDPAGRYLATVAKGETVRLWSLDTKDLVHEWPDNEGAMSLLFSNSGGLLASCDRSQSKLIRFWDPRVKRQMHGLHSFDSVYSLGAFSSDDKYIAAVVDHGQLEDDVAVAWKLEFSWSESASADATPSIGGYLKGGLKDVAFSADGDLIATSGFDHLVEVRPFAGEAGISSVSAFTRLRGGVGQAVAFDPKGGRLAIAGKDRVRLWDFRSEREVATIHHGDVLRLAFDTAGAVLTTVTAQDVRVWAVTRGKDLARKVEQTRKALEPEEVIDTIPSMRDRIGRDLTDIEKAEYLQPENVE